MGQFSANRAVWQIQALGAMMILLIISGVGCQDDNPQLEIRDYYFPVEELEEGLVYEYVPVSNDSLGTEYWFYKSLEDESGWHFTGTYYDQYFQVRQFFREDIFPNGTLMVDHFLFQADSTGKSNRIPAKINNANGFPFELQDSASILLFELEWTFSTDPLHKVTLIRNRQYREKGETILEGEKTPIVIFDLRERMDDEREGHLEKEYQGIEIYAKGVGLVYYRKDVGEGLILEYQLSDRYSMKDFEEKVNAYID